MLPNKKNLWSTPTAFDAHNIKGERKKSSGGQIEPLQQQVRMWPTPTQDSATERTKNYAQGGKPLTVAVQEEEIRMWPTPRVSDTEGGVVKNVELNNGNFSRTNKKGVRWGVKLKDAGSHVEMLPTPRASEYKGCGPVGSKSHAHMEKKNYLCAVTKDPDMPTGSLNPDWVEWLMGYGQGYTDPDNKDKFTLDSHQGFPNEPEIARVTTENQYRKDRLKALGNSIVPQIAYHIGNAILEQEKNES